MIPGGAHGKQKSTSPDGFKKNQVNISFGEQPFVKEVQLSQRFGGDSPRNIVDNSGLDGIPLCGSKNFLQPTNVIISSMQSAEGQSGVNSRGNNSKSAISVTSVMGHFEQPNGGTPNIFAQSLQQSPTNGTSPTMTKQKKKGSAKRRGKPPPAPMTQTQQNFTNTSIKIDEMAVMVSDGLVQAMDRQSQHSLEAADLGLRKSQEGKYEPLNGQDNNNEGAEKPAKEEAKNIAGGGWWSSKVPAKIHEQLVQKGFRPSSKQDGQFEYDSDTVEKYEMISNEFDYEQVRKESTFCIKQYKDGSIYRGELNDDRQREGLGVLVYLSGRVYEGEWSKNRRSGRGYELFASGNYYHGAYEAGKPNGKGVYSWQNGEVYDGEWHMGIKHGYGVWKGNNGESYIGQWQAGKAQGYGVHVFANGDKYEGEWLQCLRHGNGSDFFANGDCYVGQYTDGKPEGFGQYKWKNGSSYTGQFWNGLKYGHGKWKKKQADEFGNTKCNSYDGMYENDKKHGYGVFEWESGNRYQGNYLEDERHGYGVMKWTDESTYMGMWDQGIQHGVGVMIFPDGLKRAGIFSENVFSESLKRKEQLDPFRDQLNEECLKMLEELLSQREQSKVDLFDSKQQEPVQNDPFNQSIQTKSQGSVAPDVPDVPDAPDAPEENYPPVNRAHDFISDNASILNQPMRNADKEDLNMAMQQANPMRESLGKTMGQSPHQKFHTMDAALPPLPATARSPVVNNHGRTIEVQTELSMVTMEQYSQGYNSKAFMNRTNDFANLSPQQQASAFHQSNNGDFQNMLSKPQFRDTKHQREILGGDNPNEDTESEWNRGDSTMMVRKTNVGKMQGTMMSNSGSIFVEQNESRGRDKRAQVKINSLSQSRGRKKSNEQSLGRQGLKQMEQAIVERQGLKKGHAQNSAFASQKRVGGSQKRDPKFVDRSEIRGRQGQRKDRSLPAEQQLIIPQLGTGEFIVPGPQHQRPSKTINRHNGASLLTEAKKPQPNKFFQSQYGHSSFIMQQQQMHLQQQQYQQQLGELIQPGMLPAPQTLMNRQYAQQQQSQQHQHHHSPPPIMTNLISPENNNIQQRLNYQMPHSEQRLQEQDQRLYHGFPDIRREAGKHDTPVLHANMKRNYPNTIAVATPHRLQPNFAAMQNEIVESRHEDILTPSPKLQNQSDYEHNNRQFNQSVHHQPAMQQPRNFQAMMSDHGNRPHHDMISAAGSHSIAIEPMYYGAENDAAKGIPPRIVTKESARRNVNKASSMIGDQNSDNPFAENFRGMTSTSSQQTLRYNDFELVQKQVENDPNYEMHLDEGDEQDSNNAGDVASKDVQYPNINMKKLYESKDGKYGEKTKQQVAGSQKPPFGNPKQSLPKVNLRQSLEMQKRGQQKRQYLNSNDTQLASHTINMNASQSLQSTPINIRQVAQQEASLPNTRIVHRSLPPTNQHQASRISVKKGISIMNPSEIRLNRFNSLEAKRTTSTGGSPPVSMAQYKFVNAKSNRRGGNVGQPKGPYAQNLKKPKLYEERGSQKIAMKNHLASLQQQKVAQRNNDAGLGQFNSEVFARKKSLQAEQLGSGQKLRPISLEPDGMNDSGEKHGHRLQEKQLNHIASSEYAGNHVIQHAMLPQNRHHDSSSMPPLSGLPQMTSTQVAQMSAVARGKRIWVPYNKKMKLKGLQQNMQYGQSNIQQQPGQLKSMGSGANIRGYNPLLNSQ